MTRCLDKASAFNIHDDTADVPNNVYAEASALLEEHMAAHNRHYPPIAADCGMDVRRAGVGLPGHCSVCAIVGHVKAHPERGCDDVHCDYSHPEA